MLDFSDHSKLCEMDSKTKSAESPENMVNRASTLYKKGRASLFPQLT